MYLFSFTICCLVLKVTSQFNFQQNYPKYDYVPLVANTDQIYFEDQLGRNPETSDLNIRNETPENEDSLKRKRIKLETINIAPNGQQISTSTSQSAPNPANFNLWNQEPVKAGQSLVNKKADLINRNQVSADQNQAVFNQGQSFVNQNQASASQNQAFANQNQAFLNQNQDFGNQNQAFSNQNQAISNQNQAFSNQNQAFSNQNQAFSNQNQALGNQNEAFNQAPVNPNQVISSDNSFNSQTGNIPLGDIDLSVLLDNTSSEPETNVKSEPQIPNNQDLNGIFGPPTNIGTLNSGTPRIETIGAAVTHFGLNLLKAYGNLQDGNTVISPFSISTCLALLQQGANGKTQTQINEALLLTPEVSKNVHKTIGDDIKKRNSINILRTANNIFMAKNFQFNANFSNVAQNEFGSLASTIDITQPAVAAEEINKWVAGQTSNRIKNLVKPNSIGPTTQMILVNAIYFKGLWDISFNEAKTKSREFHLSNGQKKTVPFMRSRRYLRGGIEPATNAKIIILPFKNQEYSLMWILPSMESNVNDLIQTLTADQLLEFRDFPSQEFDVEVPKFTIRKDTNLIPILRKMGISEIFSPFGDLSRIGSNRLYSASLQVSSASHTCLLSIDENGGTGAGATSFSVVALSYDTPVKFKADRPSLVIIWDQASAVPLFMGKIMEPLEDGS